MNECRSTTAQALAHEFSESYRICALLLHSSAELEERDLLLLAQEVSQLASRHPWLHELPRWLRVVNSVLRLLLRLGALQGLRWPRPTASPARSGAASYAPVQESPDSPPVPGVFAVVRVVSDEPEAAGL